MTETMKLPLNFSFIDLNPLFTEKLDSLCKQFALQQELIFSFRAMLGNDHFNINEDRIKQLVSEGASLKTSFEYFSNEIEINTKILKHIKYLIDKEQQ